VGDMKAEIRVMSALHQALQTKYHAITILQTEADSKCRLSKKFDETTNQITPACPIMVIEQYINRHDTVCAQLHCTIWKEILGKTGQGTLA